MPVLTLFDWAILAFSLEFVFQDQAHDHTHHTDNQTAKKGRPEASDGKANAEVLADLPGEPGQKSI